MSDINPEIWSLIDARFRLLTLVGFTPQVASLQAKDLAAADVVNILRGVWDMNVSLEDIRKYGDGQAVGTPFPSAASYLRFVYFELCAGNRMELTKIRQWIATQ